MNIKIDNISKHYKDNVIALDKVSATIESGKITGLVGRNGSGKTTLIGLITNKRIPTIGKVTIDGKPAMENRDVLKHISVLAQDREAGLDYIYIRDLVKNYQYFYKDFDIEYFNKCCKLFDLTYKKHQYYRKLSTGYKNILKALLVLSTNTKIMIFDEPILGLDAVHREIFYKLLIEKYAKLNNTIIISTHLIEEVSSIVENLCIMHKGKLLFNGTAEEFVRPYAPANLQESFIKLTKEVL